MKYQLVLHFQGDDEDTLDKVTALEDQLIDAMTEQEARQDGDD